MPTCLQSKYPCIRQFVYYSPRDPRDLIQEFSKWNAGTVLAILTKALGGLLTALVHKYAGSVTKGFCLILGLVLTGAIQAVLDRKTLSTNQMVGTALVLLSSYLHFTNPVV